MNRRGFLKGVGGVAGAVVATKVAAKEPTYQRVYIPVSRNEGPIYIGDTVVYPTNGFGLAPIKAEGTSITTNIPPKPFWPYLRELPPGHYKR